MSGEWQSGHRDDEVPRDIGRNRTCDKENFRALAKKAVEWNNLDCENFKVKLKEKNRGLYLLTH
jgi:hypothetical protein